MHRTVSIAAITALAWGCSPLETSVLPTTSTLAIATSGVTLFDGGSHGFAGMLGMTCDIDTRLAVPGTDVDVQGRDDRVHDSKGQPGGGTIVLTSTRQGLALIRTGHLYDTVGLWPLAVELTGVTDALLGDDGAIYAMQGRDGHCQVIGDGFVTALPEGSCQGATSLALDSATGQLWALASGQLYAIEAGQAVDTGHRAQRAVMQSISQVLVLADGDRLLGLDPSGEQLWATSMSGQIAGLDHLGQRERLAVLTDGPQPELHIVDATTGDVLRTDPTPGAAEVVGSDDGKQLALVSSREVHFFRLRD